MIPTPTVVSGLVAHRKDAPVIVGRSIPHVAFIPLDAMFFQEGTIFVLEGGFAVMLFLRGDVLLDRLDVLTENMPNPACHANDLKAVSRVLIHLEETRFTSLTQSD